MTDTTLALIAVVVLAGPAAAQQPGTPGQQVDANAEALATFQQRLNTYLQARREIIADYIANVLPPH